LILLSYNTLINTLFIDYYYLIHILNFFEPCSCEIAALHGRLILLSCICLFNIKLGFLHGIIKLVLMYYLCMQPLHYSNNTFAHYCIFVETQELVRLPLLNSKTFSP